LKKFEAIILSGGKGSRVRKITKNIPKCLIEFNGNPFLFYQLKYLKKNKIKNVILSVGYKSNLVKEYVKRKINFINVKVVSDGKYLLGTGGAIKKSIKFLDKYFYVIYGDSFINFNLKNFKRNSGYSTMAIYKNNNKYDLSNVERKDNGFIIYDKLNKKKKYRYIDYGVSYLDKKIFKNYKKNKRFDLSVLLQQISKNFKLKGIVAKKRFFEIGSYNGIKKFRNYIKNEFYKKL
tara:strand:- start:547 stop:1248 length:702 start_codon:yes stop_codon:yes gene_type:complete